MNTEAITDIAMNFNDPEWILEHISIALQRISDESLVKRPCDLDGIEQYLILQGEKDGSCYTVMTRPRQHRHLKRKDSIRFLVLLVFSNFYIYMGCRKATRSRQPQPRKDLFKSG